MTMGISATIDPAIDLDGLEGHELYDGLLPRMHSFPFQTPAEWVGDNHTRGVSLHRMQRKAWRAIRHINEARDTNLVDGYNSTQWHEVRHMLVAMSVVTGESLESPLLF